MVNGTQTELEDSGRESEERPYDNSPSLCEVNSTISPSLPPVSTTPPAIQTCSPKPLGSSTKSASVQPDPLSPTQSFDVLQDFAPSSSPIASSSPLPSSSPFNFPSSQSSFHPDSINYKKDNFQIPSHQVDLEQPDPESETSCASPPSILHSIALPFKIPDISPVEASLATPSTGEIMLENKSLFDAKESLSAPQVEDDLEQTLPNAVSENATENAILTTPLNTQNPRIIPHLKRSTLESQKLQRKKLSAPFRSPLPKNAAPSYVLSIKDQNVAMDVSSSLHHESTVHKSANLSESTPSDDKSSVPGTVKPSKKTCTTKAAAQFKSPLSTSTQSVATSSVRLTPTIQALERSVQMFKRAVKVKRDGEDEVLKALTEKWCEAGREVAWEMWNLVKDRGMSDGNNNWGGDRQRGDASDGKREFQDAWGWDDSDCMKRRKLDSGDWRDGAEVMNPSAFHDESDFLGSNNPEPEEGSEGTLGTMLRQMGIDPGILGWDEQEETFVDK